jgi:hypothetical protein
MALDTSSDLLVDGEPFCPTCGRSGGQLFEMEDRDDSTGYRSIEVRCTRCNEREEIACHHCGATASTVANDEAQFGIATPVCCEATVVAQRRRHAA